VFYTSFPCQPFDGCELNLDATHAFCSGLFPFLSNCARIASESPESSKKGNLKVLNRDTKK
jgi:hypothetical protein